MVVATSAKPPAGQSPRIASVVHPRSSRGNGRKLRDRAREMRASFRDNDDPRAQRSNVLSLVGGQHDGAAIAGLRDEVAETHSLLRVEPCSRFVEHQQVRLAEQRLL